MDGSESIWQYIAVLPARAAKPRDVDATSFGDSVSLGLEWLFHPGDDLRWASPTFDDRNWTVGSAQREVTSYGFRGERYGWYRMHIRLRPGAPAPVVALGGVHGSYEVFVNGVRIGGHGRRDRNAPRIVATRDRCKRIAGQAPTVSIPPSRRQPSKYPRRK